MFNVVVGRIGRILIQLRHNQDNVAIYYNETEVLHWEITEFEQDGTAAIAAINAVHLAYKQPKKLLGMLKEMGKI